MPRRCARSVRLGKPHAAWRRLTFAGGLGRWLAMAPAVLVQAAQPRFAILMALGLAACGGAQKAPVIGGSPVSGTATATETPSEAKPATLLGLEPGDRACY